ncbi:MFS general substrate transporter [Trichodelitschia bisporula]|uniref:MFS general substrate transporter n=1 Tax=Trichodelitschia bisporula TaxID=703511 RepID=A0A6G1HYE2_9PEZI|nr:MFS general substrate transporter [Trichodelitschia bisporula]
MATEMEKSSVEHFTADEVKFDDGPTWTEEEERVVRRKLDWHVVPLVTLLYLLCFIDRSNIGNARIQGMSKDLALGGYKFNWALTVFYFTYIAIEVPSNVLLKSIGPRYYIPALVAAFGVVSVGTAFVKAFPGLMVARAVLGLVEGGTMPGISFFLSTFYKREELLFRIGMFVSASSMAGAFGGLLATGLSKIPRFGAHGAELWMWRNIFFFEGLFTIIVGLVAPIFMASGPGSCKFLTERQRWIATERLQREHAADPNERVTARHVKVAVFNIHNTICALGFLFVNVSVQSISLFMPTILADLGYRPIPAQLHSVPPYVVACLISIAVAWVSDRTRRRGVYLGAFACLSVMGFAILRSPVHSNIKYMAVFFVAAGAFPGGPGFLSWGLNNAGGPAVRAVTGAYIVSVGTIGSVLATWTYIDKDKPLYPKGHAINLGAQVIVVVLSICGVLYCRWENNVRASGKRDGRLAGLSVEQVVQLGHHNPEFRFIE